jgi:3-methylcrotonyl-CoA carboxylase alpha subunit
MRILIANRGEIARRIIRTAHDLGHETVAVYADPDNGAPHVAEATMAWRLGPADLAESYLSIEALLHAAASCEADAVHPGYGFLAERDTFARAVTDVGLIWIGPRHDVITQMGSKIEARRLARDAGVQIIPGFESSQDPADLSAAADGIGYPVLIKASAGGGGKGIRAVAEASGFADALREASTEAERSFGDARVIVERLIMRPRHVEVQVVGDRHGSLIHLGTRECSVQRRYQKLLEEAPAPNLATETTAALCEASVGLARSIGYDSVGTVEFVVDDTTGEFYFLEMNTRLQVEHPVTEEVTGLDLVALQLQVADGGLLDMTQEDVTIRGHAFEARITAEDAGAGFRPDVGIIRSLSVPDGVRWESGVVEGTAVTPHYDPLLAKMVVSGSDREVARRRLAKALDCLLIAGVNTTVGFHRWLIDQVPVVEGRVTTRFLDEVDPEDWLLATPDAEVAAANIAAVTWAAAGLTHSGGSPWTQAGAFRLTPHASSVVVGLCGESGTAHEIGLDRAAVSGAELSRSGIRWADASGVVRTAVAAVDHRTRHVAVVLEGITWDFRVVEREERWSPTDGKGVDVADALTAPFPALVTEVEARRGQEVAEGDLLVVLEAMKMLHSLTASGSGAIAEVRVEVGQQVESGEVLVTFETQASQEP